MKIFEFFTLKIKKKYWMVTEMCLPFSSIQWDWMSTDRSLNSAWKPDFSEHSEGIQWTFRNVSVDWKENFHPVVFQSQSPVSILAYEGVFINFIFFKIIETSVNEVVSLKYICISQTTNGFPFSEVQTLKCIVDLKFYSKSSRRFVSNRIPF